MLKHICNLRIFRTVQEAGPYMILYPRVHSNGVIEHVYSINIASPNEKNLYFSSTATSYAFITFSRS